MKYLNKFDTMSDYQQSASTLEMPNVAYITATTEVIYNATAPVQYVQFSDQLVGQKCIQLYSSDGTGCTEADLAAVTSLNASDWSGTNIVSFDELQYFTSLTSLPQSIFEGCTDLTQVTFPASDSFTDVGERAFSGCASLSTMTFVTSAPPTAGIGAFDELPPLGDLVVPEGFKDNFYILAEQLGGWRVNGQVPVEPVEYVPFADPLVGQKCIQLYSSDGVGCTMEDLAAVSSLNPNDWAGTSITSFNELQYFTGLTSLPTLLFRECSDLRSVVIPPEVTNIQSHAFFNCTSLADAYLDGANSLRYIYSQAFWGCSSLRDIEIPQSVTLIDREAFGRCSSLSSITFRGDTPPTIGTNAFYNIASTGTIFVPEGSEANFSSLAQSIGSGWTVSAW